MKTSISTLNPATGQNGLSRTMAPPMRKSRSVRVVPRENFEAMRPPMTLRRVWWLRFDGWTEAAQVSVSRLRGLGERERSLAGEKM